MAVTMAMTTTTQVGRPTSATLRTRKDFRRRRSLARSASTLFCGFDIRFRRTCVERASTRSNTRTESQWNPDPSLGQGLLAGCGRAPTGLLPHPTRLVLGADLLKNSSLLVRCAADEGFFISLLGLRAPSPYT